MRPSPACAKNWRDRHKAITASLTPDEYAQLAAMAEVQGITPSTYATKILRRIINRGTLSIRDMRQAKKPDSTSI